MNLLLLDERDLGPDGEARVSGRRARHVVEVLRASPGDRIAVGRLRGAMGTAEVLSATPEEVRLRPALDVEPPPRSPVSLLLAVPRPKILRKVLQAAASMGVRRVVLLRTWRVERGYLDSPLLEPAAIEAEHRLGLEQGRDTVPPEVVVRRLFKPFVEDELDGFFPPGEVQRLLAHPAATGPLAEAERTREHAVLAIGPEGGFTAYEAETLARLGFTPFSLGPRALRVDVAVPFAVAQAEQWLSRRGGRGPTTPAAR